MTTRNAILISISAVFLIVLVASFLTSTMNEVPRETVAESGRGTLIEKVVASVEFVSDERLVEQGRNIDGYYSENKCIIQYNPATRDAELTSYIDRLHFVSALLNCALSDEGMLEEYGDFRGTKLFNDFSMDWMYLYDTSCDKSLYRLGWTGDTVTNTDLSCVPNIEEEVRTYGTAETDTEEI